MSIQSVWQATFDFWGEAPVVVEPSAGQLTSDAGLLPLRQFDEQIGLTRQIADALEDPRDPDLCEHTFLDYRTCLPFSLLYDGAGTPWLVSPADARDK